MKRHWVCEVIYDLFHHLLPPLPFFQSSTLSVYLYFLLIWCGSGAEAGESSFLVQTAPYKSSPINQRAKEEGFLLFLSDLYPNPANEHKARAPPLSLCLDPNNVLYHTTALSIQTPFLINHVTEYTPAGSHGLNLSKIRFRRLLGASTFTLAFPRIQNIPTYTPHLLLVHKRCIGGRKEGLKWPMRWKE